MTVNGRYYTIELCAVLFEVLDLLPYGRSQTFRNLTVVYHDWDQRSQVLHLLYDAGVQLLPNPRLIDTMLREYDDYSFCVHETLFEYFLYEAVARINLPFIYPGVHPRFVAKALRKRSLSSLAWLMKTFGLMSLLIIIAAIRRLERCTSL